MIKKRNMMWILLVVMLSLSSIATNIPSSHSQNAVLALSPPYISDFTGTYAPGATFTIDLTVNDVEALWGVQFVLVWDPFILRVDNVVGLDPFTTQWPSFIYEGYLVQSWSWPLGEPSGSYFSDPTPVARIYFTVMGEGYSALDLPATYDIYETKLISVSGTVIPHTAVNGFFRNKEIHDIAVTDVTVNQTAVMPGRPISIDVVVVNDGSMNETDLNVATYFNTTSAATPQTITLLTPKKSKTLTFTWDTTGVDEGSYTISANATVVPGDINATNNKYTDGTVLVSLVIDIAVTNVTASPSMVIVGANVSINVTVQNQGSMDETFDVNVSYSNETSAYLIATQNVTLFAGMSKTLDFTWNTTGVALGIYTIRANATEVPGETDTQDNQKIDGQVGVGLQDVAVTGIVAQSQIIIGQTVAVTVSVQNNGNQNATFTIDLYYNDTNLITTQNIINLTAGEFSAYDMNWNTTGLEQGTYLLKAQVPALNGEVNTADNVYPIPPNNVTTSLVPERHDLAITSVTTNQTLVMRGRSLSIQVTVENQGNMEETFSVSTYYNATLIATQTLITVSAGGDKTLTFIWDTTGVTLGSYTISANATVVPGETETTDNTGTSTQLVTVAIHDLSVTAIAVSKTPIAVGESASVSVTVKNLGGFEETFEVSAYYANTTKYLIRKISDIKLSAGVSRTLTFSWATTGVGAGTYTLSANVTLVSDDVNSTNNAFTGGTVAVKASSTIGISASPNTFTIGEKTTISGSITPERTGVTVTISYRVKGTQAWTNLPDVQTNENGQYSSEWAPQAAGTYEVKASWAGDSVTFGKESEIQTVEVQEAGQPYLLYVVAGIVIIVIAIILVYVLKIRKPKP